MLPFVSNGGGLKIDTFEINAPSGTSVVFTFDRVYKHIQILKNDSTSIGATSTRRLELSDDGGATYGTLNTVFPAGGSSGVYHGGVYIFKCGEIAPKIIKGLVTKGIASIASGNYAENAKTGFTNALRLTTFNGNFSNENFHFFGFY
jgi:hypothetical protein